MMKKVLIGTALLLAVLVVAIIAIPFFVPLDAIRDRVIAEVKTATGRDLAIDGPVALSVFPSAAVELSDVSLSNAKGAASAEMLSLGQLDIEVALWPLLSEQIVIERLILREPVIALEIDEAGNGNWIFEPGDATEATPSSPNPEAVADDSGSGIGLSDLRLGRGRNQWRHHLVSGSPQRPSL